MIYFDNGATTYPKPAAVTRAASLALSKFGANPGRGGYPFAVNTGGAVYDVREKAAGFFGADADGTAFTLNCTHAVNFAVKGLYYAECERRGVTCGHIVISDIEHNAVLRPVHALSLYAGADYTVAETFPDDRLTIESVTDSLRQDTFMVVLTGAGNVTGQTLPLAEIYGRLRERGITLIVDGAQAAGILPLKIGTHADIICAAGHKGLYGPMGTGIFASKNNLNTGGIPLATIIEGGTGSRSGEQAQPDFLPDRLESGTGNTPGIIALGAGIDFVNERGIAGIFKHESALCELFAEQMSLLPYVTLYPGGTKITSPVVSFNTHGIDPDDLSQRLGNMGFCLRAGLHCSYLAHKKLGTLESGGTVRFTPSVRSSADDVMNLVRAIAKIRS
ncbi:cysteine desulfurase [Clostridia bacterium]|nr:cysteine desulfurase [Clostridia bacterium]